MPDTETSDSGNESPCLEEEEEIVLVSDEDMAADEPEEGNSYKVIAVKIILSSKLHL